MSPSKKSQDHKPKSKLQIPGLVCSPCRLQVRLNLRHVYVHYTRTFQVHVIPQLRPKVVDSEQFPINKFPGFNFSSLTFFVFPASHETSLSVQWMFLRILAAPLFSSFCPHCTPGFSRVMPSGKNIQKRA